MSSVNDVQGVLALSPVVFDVRTDAEWAGGHLADAVLVPLKLPPFDVGDIRSFAETLAATITPLPRDAPVAVYCKKGVRSAIAARLLRALGMTQVYDLGGTKEGPLSEYLKR